SLRRLPQRKRSREQSAVVASQSSTVATRKTGHATIMSCPSASATGTGVPVSRVSLGHWLFPDDPGPHGPLIVHDRALERVEERPAKRMRHLDQSLVADEKTGIAIRHDIPPAA